MTDQRQRVRSLVHQRSGLSGHMLDEADAGRLVATIDVLPAPPASILDIGCGTGVLVDTLADLGYAAMGIDTDERAMAAMSSPHAVASADDLPFGNWSYDAVVLNEVLEHLPVDIYNGALTEAIRVARHSIVVTVPNAEALESATARCRACGCVYSIHGHVRRFEPGDLGALFPGFALTSISTVGPFKLRHRAIEWYLKRRLLGHWPAQPGTTCPQCGRQEPVEPRAEVATAKPLGWVRGVIRLAYAIPWQRWWLVARYDRIGDRSD